MCGNGRMLIPFAQRGINIEGFDISEDMINACKIKAKQLGLTTNVHLDSIEYYRSPHKFDLIFIPFGSFSLLPIELVNRSLSNLKLALKPQGKLLLTIMLKTSDIVEIPNWIESDRKHIDGEEIVLFKKVKHDKAQSLLLTELKYQLVEDNTIIKTELMDFPMRLYDIEEFQHILKRNTFTHIKLHKVVDGYGEGSTFHVFECSY